MDNDSSWMNGVPNYLLPDPLRGEDQDSNIHRPTSKAGSTCKSKTSSKSGKQKCKSGKSDKGNQTRRFLDLNDIETRTLSKAYLDTYFEDDVTGPPNQAFQPTNWDWLRLETLGPGWVQAMREVPVNRKEALNLLVIMKKKLLKASSELTAYKERITILQDQLIFQKRNEEQLIKLRAIFKEYVSEYERLRPKAEKVPGLEKTIRQQEEIIMRLESFLNRQRNENLNYKISHQNPNLSLLDDDLFGHNLHHIPEVVPQPTESIAVDVAMRNLSNENENLRQTVNELNRTVKHLAKHHEEDINFKHAIECRHRDEMETLKQQNLRLDKQRCLNEQKRDNIEKELEKKELIRMLDNAENRVRNLENELRLRETKGKNDYHSYNGYKMTDWKYTGPPKIPLGSSDISKCNYRHFHHNHQDHEPKSLLNSGSNLFPKCTTGTDTLY